jgi:hypothetical protein
MRCAHAVHMSRRGLPGPVACGCDLGAERPEERSLPSAEQGPAQRGQGDPRRQRAHDRRDPAARRP